MRVVNVGWPMIADRTTERERSSRNVGQPDYILPNPVVSQEMERRPGSGKVRFAVTKHNGVQVNSILID